MTCEVAVFGFTLSPTTYTYLVPPTMKVAVGHLVTFPFGKRKARGLIVSVSSTSNSPYQLKELSGVESENPLLTKNQLALAHWIAENYFISLAESIGLFIPRIPKTGLPHNLSDTKQELILCPTFKQVEEIKKQSGGIAVSYHTENELSNQTWLNILAGKERSIISTKSGLFLPFHNLTKITVFQTESNLYKDERRPYYRVLDVARALAKIWKAELKAVSYSPRISDQYYTPHQIRTISEYSFEKKVLGKEGVVDKLLIKELNETAAKTILVFMNNKSEKGPLTCHNCKVISFTDNPAQCPNCGSSDVKFKVLNLRTVSEKIKQSIPEDVSRKITFSTQQIFFQGDIKFDFIILLSADTYLNRGSWNAEEETFIVITNLLRLLNTNGKILLQTSYKNNLGINLSLRNNYQDFYTEELKSRKLANYPPYSKMAKITYAAKGIPSRLDLSNSLETYGPFDAKYQYFIVRGKNLSALKQLGRPWKLDIDPLSL